MTARLKEGGLKQTCVVMMVFLVYCGGSSRTWSTWCQSLAGRITGALTLGLVVSVLVMSIHSLGRISGWPNLFGYPGLMTSARGWPPGGTSIAFLIYLGSRSLLSLLICCMSNIWEQTCTLMLQSCGCCASRFSLVTAMQIWRSSGRLFSSGMIAIPRDLQSGTQI